MRCISWILAASALGACVPHRPLVPTRIGAAESPIASSVQLPAGYELIYVSGSVPDAVNPTAPQGSVERFGDTEAQTRSVLGKIERELGKHGLHLGSIVMMRVFLVAPPGQEQMDFQ